MNEREEYERWANALDEGMEADEGHMERTYEAFQARDDDYVTIEPPPLGEWACTAS